MNTNGPGAGGAILSPPPVPPGQALRAVAFAPAVRGYPGGIADMAAEQDGLAAGDSGEATGSWTGEPGATAPAGAGRQNALSAVAGASVWQQSLAAWQKAGIDWLREARPAPSVEDHAAAEADLQHTQPIPVVPAADPPGRPGAGERLVGPASETAGAAAGARAARAVPGEDVADEDVIVLSGTGAATGSGAAGAAVAEPGSVAPEDGADGPGPATGRPGP